MRKLQKHLHFNHKGTYIASECVACYPVFQQSPFPFSLLWVGFGGFSKVVATFNHVGRSFDLFMATTGDVWIIPSFRIWGYVHVEHISCVITNCDQHQWVIPSPLSIALELLLEENIARKLLCLFLTLFFKILLFQVAFLIVFSIVILSPNFIRVGLLSQYVALFQSGNYLSLT